jgi:hypothetical protein
VVGEERFGEERIGDQVFAEVDHAAAVVPYWPPRLP